MKRGVQFLFAAALCCTAASAYSVLTHEAIIDTTWDDGIKPLLLKRFPDSTPDALTEAHAYAYGGCIIQDMGYYPFGSKFFSDLTHYVRSGDFVLNLIRESRDLDEYAFALGAMAHYAADNEGHPIAVNRSVPIEYPKLRREYGPVVTYGEDPDAHIKTEFGFDVLQVARGNYAPKSYHDFIGFQVSKDLLERAFFDTYSLHLKDVFKSLDLSIGTYRHTISSIIPETTKVAWDLKKDDLLKATPGLTRRKFLYNLSRASYEKEWDRKYEKPGVVARVLAFMFRIVPKVGPFKAVAFKPPTPETARLFEESFNRTLDLYRSLLRNQARDHLALENRDFDTGRPTAPGEYKLADDTFSKLARTLSKEDPSKVNPEVRATILAFFRNPEAPIATKRNLKVWEDTVVAVDELRAEAAPSTADRVSAP